MEGLTFALVILAGVAFIIAMVLGVVLAGLGAVGALYAAGAALAVDEAWCRRELTQSTPDGASVEWRELTGLEPHAVEVITVVREIWSDS